MTGLRRDRVAELIVAGVEGRYRGSGYLVTDTSVLTAAHVLDGAESVRVRFEPDLPDEWVTDAVSWWVDPQSDLAVVSIEPRPGEPARFGGVGERAAVLTVQAVGFPKWKLRDGAEGQRYRDAYHAVGTVAVLSNWREGTLEVAVDAVPAGDSPWEGMSGAAVWVGDRIIGVLAKHHPTDGPSRLAAIRLDQAVLDRLSITSLPDVVPPEPAHLVPAAYRAQLADIAPGELRGRAAELNELVQFCAGATFYAWWQAGPWAGKSALMSWFALHPPAGTDVVSFFVTSRFAGQSDSDAYIDAMLEQLAVLNDEPPQPVEPRARGRHLLRLLDAVANRCVSAGRRLLVLVDGLDEDTSLAPGVDRPSIASLLPRRPLPGLRVLVSSRPNPALPFDVPADHPLHATPPRWLQTSSHAQHVAKAATAELTRMLAGSDLQREVLGFITASGGGLTHPDLQALTGQAPYQIDELLGGLFGRSIRSHTTSDIERVYVFAHETLRERAQASFGPTLSVFHHRIDTWADSYAGWPATTPAYLLRGYSRVLVDRGELHRLLDYATDPARQARSRTVTGGDALTFGEMSMAHNLIVRSPTPDLGAALRLALARSALAEHSENLPVDLPAVWAKLGHVTRAVGLANGILHPSSRIQAYGAIVKALVDNGEGELAREVIGTAEAALREIDDGFDMRFRTADVAEALVRVDQPDRAQRIADEIADVPLARETLFGRMALASTDLAHSERWLEEISNELLRLPVLIQLATVLADRGDTDQAVALTARYAERGNRIADPRYRARYLSSVAEAFVAAGAPDQADELITEAEALLTEVSDSDVQAEMADHVATAAAAVGDVDRAEWLVRTFSPQEQATNALARISVALAKYEPRMALSYLEEVEDDWAVAEVCKTFARTGNHDLALEVVGQVEQPEKRARLLTQLLPLAPNIMAGPAEAAAREIESPSLSAEALTELAGAVADTGDAEGALRLVAAAEATVREHSDPARRTLILTATTRAVAHTGDTQRVRALLDTAEAVVAASPSGTLARKLLAETMADLGVADRAELADNKRAMAAAAEAITEPAERFREYVRVAVALAAAGDHRGARDLIGRCESLVRVITYHPHHISKGLVTLAKLAADLADHGQRDHLLDLAEWVAANDPLANEHPDDELLTLHRNEALLAIGAGAVETGDYQRIRRLIESLPAGYVHDSMTLTLIRALVRDGEFTEATELVGTIEAPDREALAWTVLTHAGHDHADAAEAAMQNMLWDQLSCALAVAVARHGNHARAMRLISETASPFARALTLDVITEQSPEPAYRRLIAETIGTDEWLWVLPAVAALDPQALHRFCDQLR